MKLSGNTFSVVFLVDEQGALKMHITVLKKYPFLLIRWQWFTWFVLFNFQLPQAFIIFGYVFAEGYKTG